MRREFFALFAAAALLLGMSACSTVDNPSSGGGNAQEDPVVAPAQLKQGVWTEYDSLLVASGKYTAEELAEMPTVGMWIQGDKGYFFTYTAEDMSETVEGQISYNNIQVKVPSPSLPSRTVRSQARRSTSPRPPTRRWSSS